MGDCGAPPHLGSAEEAGRPGRFLLLRKPWKDSCCPSGNHPDLQKRDTTRETQSLEISAESSLQLPGVAVNDDLSPPQFAPFITLTAKLDVGGSADDGAAAVDGQALIGARISSGLRAADHQAACDQGVARVHAQRDLCAVHQPPAGGEGMWVGDAAQRLTRFI